MISGQLSPQGVQTTLQSCPFKPHTFISREALSLIKAFFSAMKVHKCIILQLHKNLHGGTGARPNQNMWSHAHKILIQVRLLGFGAIERERERVTAKGNGIIERKSHYYVLASVTFGFLSHVSLREKREWEKKKH